MMASAKPPSPPDGREPEDLELIRGIASGSEESFRLLFERWAGRLGRFLTRATNSKQTGEDLLQEAFMRILRAAPAFEPRGEVKAWIYRIGANLAYSHWRSESRSPFRGPRAGAGGWEDQASQAVSPRREEPEARHLRRSFAEQAFALVDRLPANQRIVFMMKVDQGLNYEEIASVLRCPVGTAKSRFHHAVCKLRTGLRDWESGLSSEMPTLPAAKTGRGPRYESAN
jgi:RNA polymerase sigma-70 factor (ECF subfamily)